MIKERLFVGLLFFSGVCFGQISQIKVPQSASLGIYGNDCFGNPQRGIPATPAIPSLPLLS